MPVEHGLGGRNQHTVLAAAHDVLVRQKREWPAGTLVASFGTDGEDGPTSAAGGFIDSDVANHLVANPRALQKQYPDAIHISFSSLLVV